MLAIKECLIREGVLNLNSSNLSTEYDMASPYSLHTNLATSGSNLNMLNNSSKKSATDVSGNDLSSTNSITAKISCQQQQAQATQQNELFSKPQSRKLPKRYQGHHPHFHHHTAPAYYTDLHLKIHTPEAKDSVNENYQSVYRTPSKLIKDEHQFPKTTTATLLTPLSLSPQQKLVQKTEAVENQGSFFCGSFSQSDQKRLYCNDPYMSSNNRLPTKPTKGSSSSISSPSDLVAKEDNSCLPLAVPVQSADGSVVFACTDLKPCVTADIQLPIENVTNRSRSRNSQRFGSRKKVVRVRSESRPISALYDIICKEKGFHVGTTTTNDEDSSLSHSNDDEKVHTNHSTRARRSHSRSVTRQTKLSLTNSNNSNMSGAAGNNLSGGDRTQYISASQQKKRNEKYTTNTIFNNDLSDDDDDDYDYDDEIHRLEGVCSRNNFSKHNSHKKINLWNELQQSKSSSLPPGLISIGKLNQKTEIHNNSHDSLCNISSNVKINNKESLEFVRPSSGSKILPNSEANHALLLADQQSTSFNPSVSSNTITNTNTNTSLSIEPIIIHMNSSCSLYDQTHTGAGTTTTNSNQSQQNQLKQQQTKTDRYSRKHRRLRDDKPRRHTDGAIKIFPSDMNNFHSDDLHDNDHHQRLGSDFYSHDDDDDDNNVQHHPLHYSDLNGAGHDFHTVSSAAAANAKRYITRSQRGQQQEKTNDSRSSPSIASHQDLNSTLQQDLSRATNFEITTATTIESIDHTIKTNGEDKKTAAAEEEMTNNSGKKSKTATTTATATTNTKELRIKNPLTSAATTTIAATTAAAAATAAVVPDASCSSTTDKKRDEEKLQQQRFTSPTSPKAQHYASPFINCSDNAKLTTSGSETDPKILASNGSQTHRGNKRLVPSVSVSMKQNPSEAHCTASQSNILCLNPNLPKSLKQKLQNNRAECTNKINTSPKVKTKSYTSFRKASQYIDNVDDIDTDILEIIDMPLNPMENNDDVRSIRPRCSTMLTDSDTPKASNVESNNHVDKNRTSSSSPKRNEERDKSSKRKSNLNRSLNEEATPDGDENAIRRRRRREMGMARPLIPDDEDSLKALISAHKTCMSSPPKSAVRNDLSYHMEMARRGLDLPTASDRRRAQAATLKNQKDCPSPKTCIPISKTNKRCDIMPIGELRMERSSEVNRKLNECTRTGLEEIKKIVENVSESSSNPCNTKSGLTHTINRLQNSQEKEIGSLNLPCTNGEEQRRLSPVKHATFVQEERIYYEPDPLENIETSNGEKGGMLRSLRMLKARSIERETDAYEPTKRSPILRRKSTDCPPSLFIQGSSTLGTPNHIVSILKKKDYLSAGESSSASSNASPVTFSSSVIDTPSKQKRVGILKKRSSLDESRYYSRSHSPDERNILIKSARRNSLEEVANGSSSSSSGQGYHGILKQSSYDSSKSDGCPSATREPQQPHSILKKKDSTSTPSDGGDHAPKHVSISQAVILAAAELSAAVETGDKFPNDDLNYTPNNEEYDIKSILKLDSSTSDESIKPPKPILKKKSSADSDEHEIKPILKTSRKSSREEFEFGPYSDSEVQQESQVKPILKTDSPSKRRSLGGSDGSNTYEEVVQCEIISPFLLKRRTRSLERHDQAPVIDLAAALNAIATSQALPNELVTSLTNSTPGSNISVAERIKSVEKFLANQSGLPSSPGEKLATTTSTVSSVKTSEEFPLQHDPICPNNADGEIKILKPSVIKRDLYKDRFKTQPITTDEKNFLKNDASISNVSLPSGSVFKPAQSLEGLGFSHLSSHGCQTRYAPPSAFNLTRSFTQPLSGLINSPPQCSSSVKTEVPVPLPRKSLARDLTLSFTGEPNFSNNSNIFEMSALEQDIDMTENQEPKASLNKEPTESLTPSASVVRTNSVKARANMFQQMQQNSNKGVALNREERTSPKKVTRLLSPSPAVNSADEPKTPINPPPNPNDDIEPSSLPLSERLRFFSNLSDASKRNLSCSFSRSPPFNSIERSSSISSCSSYMAITPRSSTSLSSASVTPTPMECPLPSFMESTGILRKDSSTSTLENEAIEAAHDLPDARFSIKADTVKTSPFLQSMPNHIKGIDGTPTTTLTPTMKRIKLKTIGKLLLPSTFLNNSEESPGNKESTSLTINSKENENFGPPKKIGKIKSPFIENCNQKQQKQKQIQTQTQTQIKTNTNSIKFDYSNKMPSPLTALTSLENSAEHYSGDISMINNGSGLNQRKHQNTFTQTNGYHHNEDFSTDSGKENVDTSLTEQTEPVVEIRRKFSRKTNTSQSFNTSTASGITRYLTPRSASLNGPHSSRQVDEKYAKYFGISTSIKSAKPINQPSPLPQKVSQLAAVQSHFRQQQNERSTQPKFMAVNRNIRLWHSSGKGVKRLAAVINELKKFEDIIVTDRELKLASSEFDNLLLNDSMLKHSSKELENIFSSIV